MHFTVKVEQGATAPISRAELWKAGHKRKTGEYISQEAADLAAKIVSLSYQLIISSFIKISFL